MILPLLMNIALGAGKLEVEADAKNYRLVTRAFGTTITLAKLDKEAVYQLTRTPEMPATRDEAVDIAAKAFEEHLKDESKVLADDPVPLPVQRPERRKPQLSIIQGGAA
ncbi:hypothetical protein [Rhizobium laguerreae]|uniref:hypothetical protein n=1 Tax=Rhizobium laguerreae TaxID=1076926 RepID=UPI001C92A5D9|nr:hypothetical protein [Rhizobium laguerreae]MBY3231812.1 hypothetical protein [Rhizobium laguerreae]